MSTTLAGRDKYSKALQLVASFSENAALLAF
jgi:hypothetical protein